MLKTFDETKELIAQGKLMHIAGTEELLRKLPKGDWVGGSTEYFMDVDMGKVTDEMLFVNEFTDFKHKISMYDAKSIHSVARDAFDGGLSIVILPYDSAVQKEYAEHAAEFDDMFMKDIAGWVSGLNLGKTGQTPVSVNGQTGEVSADKAAVLHLQITGYDVDIEIVNIFTADKSSPVIEFAEEGFCVTDCVIGGKSTSLAEYIGSNGVNTQLPLVGDYSGIKINISFKSIEDGKVYLYAPVFPGIKYRFAAPIEDYAAEFKKRLGRISEKDSVFSCNCVLNFLYGELEGKSIGKFSGPITFGEVAYQLVNQTLVYVTFTPKED